MDLEELMGPKREEALSPEISRKVSLNAAARIFPIRAKGRGGCTVRQCEGR